MKKKNTGPFALAIKKPIIRANINGKSVLMGKGSGQHLLDEKMQEARKAVDAALAAQSVIVCDDGITLLTNIVAKMMASCTLKSSIPRNHESAEDALRRMLPQVIEATKLLHNEMEGTFNDPALSQIIDDFEAKAEALRNDHNIRQMRLRNLASAAHDVLKVFPKPLPAKMADWHDDACEIVTALREAFEASSVTIGMSRADSKGVKIIQQLLQAGTGLEHTGSAISQMLKSV